MIKEIKRNGWSKFFKKFNSENQYRQVTVNTSDERHHEGEQLSEFPFMGVALEKKGHLIDGIQLFTGWPNSDRVTRAVVSIKQPAKVILEKNADGTDSHLDVKTRDGAQITLVVHGEKNPNRFVQEVAYSIYERRGYTNGYDIGDWVEAEEKVRAAEELFV